MMPLLLGPAQSPDPRPQSTCPIWTSTLHPQYDGWRAGNPARESGQPVVPGAFLGTEVGP